MTLPGDSTHVQVRVVSQNQYSGAKCTVHLCVINQYSGARKNAFDLKRLGLIVYSNACIFYESSISGPSLFSVTHMGLVPIAHYVL